MINEHVNHLAHYLLLIFALLLLVHHVSTIFDAVHIVDLQNAKLAILEGKGNEQAPFQPIEETLIKARKNIGLNFTVPMELDACGFDSHALKTAAIIERSVGDGADGHWAIAQPVATVMTGKAVWTPSEQCPLSSDLLYQLRNTNIVLAMSEHKPWNEAHEEEGLQRSLGELAMCLTSLIEFFSRYHNEEDKRFVWIVDTHNYGHMHLLARKMLDSTVFVPMGTLRADPRSAKLKYTSVDPSASKELKNQLESTHTIAAIAKKLKEHLEGWDQNGEKHTFYLVVKLIYYRDFTEE